MPRKKNDPAKKMMAIIFTKDEQKIFEEYRDTFGFENSADAYRGLLDLVEEKWNGIKLKNDQRFSIRLSMDDYIELDRIRENLGGISRSETLRRGVSFLYRTTLNRNEFLKWKKFAAGIPHFLRTGKKKENGLASGKMVVYSMNDLSHKILKDICDAFEESRTSALRLALEVMKVLPPEKFLEEEEEKFHSTVRLREDEYKKMERLKARLNFNGNGIFRTGVFLAGRELKERKLKREGQKGRLSVESELIKTTDAIPANTIKQRIILRP